MQQKLLYLLLLFTMLFTRVSAQSPLQQFDDRVMLDLQDHRAPAQTDVMLFLTNTYRYGDYGIPAGLMVAGIINNDKGMRENSVYIASSTALSYGVTLLLKQLVKRPRPFIQNIKIVPVYRAEGTSFPSGHTSTTFSTATALAIAYPKWYVIAPAFLWASSVEYSRMYLGEHYPTDVASGALIGAGSAVTLSFMKK